MESITKPKTKSPALSRRQFLAAVGAAGATCLTFSGKGAASASHVSLTDNPYSFSALNKFVGDTFLLQTPNGNLQAVLDRVVENNSSPMLQQFTAVFQIPVDKATELTQDVYLLHHTSLGQLSLLLLPTGTGSACCMSATFSHLKGVPG